MTNVVTDTDAPGAHTPAPDPLPDEMEPAGGFSSLRQPLFARYVGTLTLSMTGNWVRPNAGSMKACSPRRHPTCC